MNRSAARIGCARVPSVDQNADARITALKTAGCTMVRAETGSGVFLENRSELQIILDFIHPGETLVVTRINRLARSMHDLQVIVATRRNKGAHLAATQQPLDTSTAAGKAFFDMLGVFAAFETNLGRGRQAERILAAKQRVACRGRPPRIDMKAPRATARQRPIAHGNRPREGHLTWNCLQAHGEHDRQRITRSAKAGCAPGNVVIGLEMRHRAANRSRCALQDVPICTFGPLGPDRALRQAKRVA